jgi:hypothetical protein
MVTDRLSGLSACFTIHQSFTSLFNQTHRCSPVACGRMLMEKHHAIAPELASGASACLEARLMNLAGLLSGAAIVCIAMRR